MLRRLAVSLALLQGAESLLTAPALAQRPRPSVTRAPVARPSGNEVAHTPLALRPYGVAVTPEGELYVGRVDAPDLTVYEFSPVKRLGRIPMLGAAYEVLSLPDAGTAYAVNVPAHALSVIDRATGAVLRTIEGLGEPFRVRASPEGAFVFVTTSTGGLHRVSTDDDSILTVQLAGVLNGLAVNERRGVLYASSTDGMVYEVDMETLALRRSTMIGGRPQGMAVSADGTTLFLANEALGAQVIDATSLAVSATIEGTDGAFDVALTADGVHLYVSRPLRGRVSVVDVESLAIVRTHTGGQPRRMAFTPDGSVLVIANEAGWVTFIR